MVAKGGGKNESGRRSWEPWRQGQRKGQKVQTKYKPTKTPEALESPGQEVCPNDEELNYSNAFCKATGHSDLQADFPAENDIKFKCLPKYSCNFSTASEAEYVEHFQSVHQDNDPTTNAPDNDNKVQNPAPGIESQEEHEMEICNTMDTTRLSLKKFLRKWKIPKAQEHDQNKTPDSTVAT